jgi:hypothetical protein
MLPEEKQQLVPTALKQVQIAYAKMVQLVGIPFHRN